MIPLAISSQRVMPPKMLKRIALTFASEVITSSASTIASALEPPPASRKLAGSPPGLGDDVEGRHAEPGAVAEDADVAVELDVGEALLLRHRAPAGPRRSPPPARRAPRGGRARSCRSSPWSRARPRRGPAVTISGLTSISVASSSLKASIELHEHRRGLRRGRPRRARRRRRAARASASPKPSSGRCGGVTRASGSFSAISSTSIPPIVESIASSFFAERSRMTEA